MWRGTLDEPVKKGKKKKSRTIKYYVQHINHGGVSSLLKLLGMPIFHTWKPGGRDWCSDMEFTNGDDWLGTGSEV